MTDLTYLKELFQILKSNQVTAYKEGGLEIRLLSTKIPDVDPSPSPAMTIDSPQESNLPPDLRADTLMDEDKILNWSAPPSGDDSFPLTGDLPL